ncbi:hypothetical protein M948_19200 [Virgibacillus sp. CM-4]|uniref:hypothetical protein n=1 Tax=Virgibacillus sp. CM-4 TaxID=1354277 RepID=UPI0003888CC5|nr:hypothetical protein [Virgibacillus sp. CM-4]EQB35229.1 hypothetical protein M948_19200 [Virgibacillus sp. CM-4]
MPEHKNNLFRDMNIREKTATIVGIGSLIILVLSFVIGLYFFGLAGIFNCLAFSIIQFGLWLFLL